MSYAHPGSIQVAVGEALRMIRVNIEQNDPEGVAKFCRDLRGTTSIYAEDEPALWKKVMAIPAFDYKKDPWPAFEDEMQRRDLCLLILRKANIFGYVGAPALGNSDALLDALEEPAEEGAEG